MIDLGIPDLTKIEFEIALLDAELAILKAEELLSQISFFNSQLKGVTKNGRIRTKQESESIPFTNRREHLKAGLQRSKSVLSSHARTHRVVDGDEFNRSER